MDHEIRLKEPVAQPEPEPEPMNAEAETMADRITRVRTDYNNLYAFYNIKMSPARYKRLREYFVTELDELHNEPFEKYSGEDKIDYLLLQNFLTRNLRDVDLEHGRDKKMEPLMPFAPGAIEVCERRQGMVPLNPKDTALQLSSVAESATKTMEGVEAGELKVDKTTALRAGRNIDELANSLAELRSFYSSYDPMFDWWTATPCAEAIVALSKLAGVIRTKIVGLGDKADEIVGEPIGREGLLSELEAEMIPYSPEQLIKLAGEEFKWCEKEMKKASEELGFGEDWKKALEHVKTLYVGPGLQIQYVRNLALEGAEYVTKHDLVTVPKVAAETYRMFMIPPEQQKESPFFLGGPTIQVSYPTASMSHADKLMVMRGNNKSFSRATAFHELIPGHRLQLFMADRHRTYRKLFRTPFIVEGWALYWELVLWSRGDFFVLPEDKVGTIFWRMHRCARIVFSLRFHLGEMTPQECVDLLVTKVGHERSTAEGEVRRSFAGSYGPLYQAGYLLGALQLWSLRQEVLQDKLMGEKEFHDRILKANEMPVEMMRELILKHKVEKDFKSQWKFYGDL
jgi:hypothetical protein